MDKVKYGIDVLKDNSHLIKDMNIGLITNHTGLDTNLKSTIDILYEIGDLKCLFSPEHGVRGNFQAGVHVPDYVDEKTGVKVYSLYGDIKKPKEYMLKDVDALLFDIQDVGARFYTYLYTMAYAMEAAKEFNKKFIVLDRPNPIGGMQIEGNILDTNFSSFVGMYPIPIRYGLTLGEFAVFINQEFNINCDLEIIKMENWKRDKFFDELSLNFIAPSPNIPTIDSAILYIGTCLFEGTNVSEGRGTTQPFQIIGAPWIDCYKLADELNELNLEGVVFRPHYFTPAFSKYQGELCQGVQIHVIDRKMAQPFKIGVTLISRLYQEYKEFNFLPPGNDKGIAFFDLLAGTDKLRKAILKGSTDVFFERCENEIKQFKNIRKNYILY